MATDQNGDLLINNEGAAALDEHEQKSSALGFLSNTDVLRQITLILGLTICLAIAVFILLWGKEPEMRPLGTFTTQELVSTLDYLDQQKIPYQVDGKSVLVSAENYADIRLRLTRAGLANNSDASNDGEAILLKDSSFGVSQRMESERLKLSRERQLASAIEQFQ
ncbi:flagellar basal body M-ring protein FliF, partial [Aeromonas sp. CPF2-S1]|nr:flagellar basal body M-ring protein FliF [Aeromonas sp. CPF2-S1]